MHREQLIDALWPEVDTADNRLHKAGHFVRRAVGSADAIVIGGDAVTLFPGGEVTTDVEEFEALAREALRDDSEALAADAVALYSGELLPLDPYEEWATAPRQRLALLHRELLRMLGRFDELVALDPTDEGAHVAIMQRMIDRGDGDGALLQFDVLRRMLDEELGIGPSEEAVAARDLATGSAWPAAASGNPPAEERPRYATLATQRIRRTTAPDGVRLAYATSGTGPPLVKAANWMSHLDLDWGSPIWTPLWQELGRHHTLVRYDERGSGLSDWDVDRDSFTLDAWVRDLETVVDELGLERFPLLGLSHGGVVAITYAARHPERVSHLIVLRHLLAADLGARVRRGAHGADGARAAHPHLVGRDFPRVSAGVRRQVHARRAFGDVACLRRPAAPLDLAAERVPPVEGLRRPGPVGCGAVAGRADADHALA